MGDGPDSRGPDSCRIETVHMHICNRTVSSGGVATGHMYFCNRTYANFEVKFAYVLLQKCICPVEKSCISSAFVFLTNFEIFAYVLLFKYICPVEIRVFPFLILFTRDSCIFAYVLLQKCTCPVAFGVVL